MQLELGRQVVVPRASQPQLQLPLLLPPFDELAVDLGQGLARVRQHRCRERRVHRRALG
jgi:hypothetical protein